MGVCFTSIHLHKSGFNTETRGRHDKGCNIGRTTTLREVIVKSSTVLIGFWTRTYFARLSRFSCNLKTQETNDVWLETHQFEVDDAASIKDKKGVETAQSTKEELELMDLLGIIRGLSVGLNRQPKAEGYYWQNQRETEGKHEKFGQAFNNHIVGDKEIVRVNYFSCCRHITKPDSVT